MRNTETHCMSFATFGDLCQAARPNSCQLTPGCQQKTTMKLAYRTTVDIMAAGHSEIMKVMTKKKMSDRVIIHGMYHSGNMFQ